MNIVIQLLNLFIAGEAGVQQYIALRDQLSAMQAEGREPTEAEWQAMIDGINADSDALDKNDK